MSRQAQLQQHHAISLTKTDQSQLLVEGNDDGTRHFPGRTDDIYETSNLTDNQLLMWVEQKLNPEVPLYNMVMTFTITGEIKPAHFQKAFQALVDRSDALRTVIEEVDDIPQQHILSQLPYSMDYLDFSEGSDPQAAFQTWLDQRYVIPFNLGECCFDSALIKIANDQYIWYLNQHHIITDGWSTSLIYQRVAEFYERSLKGQLGEAPALPCFQDYVDYERAYRRSSEYVKAEAYWQQKLAEPLEPTRFYGKALSQKTPRTQRVVYDLGRQRSQKLKAIAVQEGVRSITLHLSLFNIFTSFLFTYLYRVSSNRRLAIGAPFHNRSSMVLKDTVGLLMEVCPLQVEIAEDETFLSLIEKVKNETHQVLRYARKTTGNPIYHRNYDVTLNYLNAAFPDFSGLRTQAKFPHSGFGVALNDLYLLIHASDDLDSFLLHFDFNCDVFDEKQRSRVIQHFLHIVDGFLADRTQPISRVNLLSEEERQCVLAGFNQTTAVYPADHTIVQLFEAQVEQTPDRIAVEFPSTGSGHSEGEQLTYQELNEHANQLARHLKALGVGPETLVGIYVERSLEMIVGLLGVLKAGGAYVPLDPAFPKERLAFMLTDSQAKVLLTQQSLVEEVPKQGKVTMLCLDSDWDSIGQQSIENLSNQAKTDNLAYVIYTSGSTGRPKGVQIQHGAVVNFLMSMRQEPGLADKDVLLSVTTLSFDIAVLEIFLPLITRARLVLVSRETAVDGIQLMAKLADSGATVMQATPTTWRMLIESGWRGDDRLKILCGGEALPRALANQLLERCGSLWNMYGPTETTIWSAVYQVQPGAGSVPIGRPIANTQLYVLDAHKDPVPIGVPGELYIGGAGLARGYLNRPKLTAEKFVADPFGDEEGGRVYRTGDLVRYLPDGNIEFLGRIDHQIKIRGFRVEPGEIEALLAQHPALREVVVIAREDVPGDKRLVAYMVLDQEQAPTTSELRNLVRAKLADYMVPSAFVMLDALPLTPNGKVDRRALPAPDGFRPDLEATYVAPRGEVERIIAAIWKEVLNLEKVGIHDNFFDLGGHSILVVRVHSKLQDVFDSDLSAVEMFQYPTIRSMTEHLSLGQNESPSFQKIHNRAQEQRDAINRQKQLRKERWKIR